LFVHAGLRRGQRKINEAALANNRSSEDDQMNGHVTPTSRDDQQAANLSVASQNSLP